MATPSNRPRSLDLANGKSTPPKGNTGWILAAVVIVGVLIISEFGSSDSAKTTPMGLSATNAGLSDLATPSPPALTTLSTADLRLGVAAYTKASAVDDATSAMIYSKNCYAALEQAFSWAKLDRCGTFDAMAAGNVLSEALFAEGMELSHFDTETAAGRYLFAGTTHGVADSVMDARWDALTSFGRNALRRAEAARARKAAAEAASAAAVESTAAEDNQYVDEAGNLVGD